MDKVLTYTDIIGGKKKKKVKAISTTCDILQMFEKNKPKCRISVEKLRYNLTVCITMEKVSSRRVLLIKCNSLINHQQVWRPLYKQNLWYYIGWCIQVFVNTRSRRNMQAAAAAFQSVKG